ncbi:SusC/RagA family TonB-linked outer membrane protein [Pedobacter insulae]|uniref:TonB-linked outer membrane protein, SusC/RagA family n=1 Tax=Pedobacter insulae TaxID=414048 RepID=A0A1I2V0W2_9SPHI|nr:SusC/RagA family TonB-linked outer membrane protein [Pedobacter insulae]SFG82998.1 TonB-linked outer membrane protein, SusC/RagA family [Pedobacter insulae]
MNLKNYLSRLFGVIAIMIIPWAVFAQTKITGTVKDATGPIPGVSILEKGTKNGTLTNSEGQFTLTLTKPSAVLEFKMLGFITKDLSTEGKSSLSVILEEDTRSLSEVVLIGYQRITRKKNTASISSISAKELENLPAASFDQLLQGRVSGVNVQNFSGQPGTAPTVSVRGNSLLSRGYDEFNVVNSPLYVVDGVPQPTESYVGPGTGTGTNYLAGINPMDIESIDILKDASAAAIYGSRAANGVILITTKKGTSGDPRVGINTYYGVTARPELRDVTLGTVERRQKLAILENQLTYADQKQLPYLLTDSLNSAFNGNTDWQDMFYQQGRISNVDLNLSGGGNGGMIYRFSGGAYNEEGIIKATGFKRYTGRLNLSSKALKERLTINPLVAFSRSDRARGNGSSGSPIALGSGNMPSSLFNMDDEKRAFLLGEYDENLDKNISNQLTLNLNMSYDFSPNFRFTSQSSYKGDNDRRDFNRGNALQNNQGNYSYSFASNAIDLLTSNFLSYNNTFKKHSLSAVVGQDIQYNQYQTITASGSNGASDNIQVVNGFQQAKIGAGSDYQAYGLLSYYARIAYDFDSKYLFSFSARADGSSRFGKNNKWGYFPSASAAWLLSEEDFMKDNKLFSMVKLRASIGNSGSLPTSNYLQYNLYNVNAAGYFGGGGSTSYNGVTAITPNFYDGVAQKNLSWQKSMQWNIGTDIELKNGKFAFQFEVYNKESSLQLFSVNLPLTTGYDLALTNSIGVRNSGAEVTVIANPLKASSKFRWTTQFNISYNKNRIMSLPNGGRDLVMDGDRFDKSHILSVGSPINAFYLYRTKGVFKSDADVPQNPFTGEKYRNSNGTFLGGMFYFDDLDGDYFTDVFNSGINPDKLPMGDPNPKYTGGWTNNFSYKGFSLQIFSAFTFDRDVLNLFEADRFSTSTDGNAVANYAQFSSPDYSNIDIWRNQGDDARYAKVDLGSYRYYYTSAQSFFLEKGGWFRIKSINVGYQLPAPMTKKLGMSKLKIFGIADNVAMFQQSKRLPDAEAVNPYGEYNGAGYPIPRKYTLGLEIQF